MANLKHVGRFKATGRKCLVAYRTLPGDSDSALVIQTENLTDDQHDAIIRLVESPAGQSSYEFAEVLARANFPDGSLMLPNLHYNSRLTKVKTSEIEMIPNSQTTISLDQLNQMIAQQRGISVNDLALGNQTTEQEIAQVKEVPSAPVEYNEPPATVASQDPQSFDTPEAEAKHYRSQADKLAKQAAEFRRRAEELAPTKKAKTTA